MLTMVALIDILQIFMAQIFFERYYLVDNVFQHAELEFLNYDVPTFDPITGSIELNRKTVSALYLGLGYQSGQNGRGSYISFLYDIFYDVHSRNPNPRLSDWLQFLDINIGILSVRLYKLSTWWHIIPH